MVTESYLQHGKSIEWSKFLQARFPTPLCTFQWYFKNPVSIIPCFLLYSFPFHFKFYKFVLTLFQLWLHSYELVQYNQFQISAVKYISKEQTLVPNFILKANFEFWYLWHQWVWKRLDISFKSYNLVCSKYFFRLYINIILTATCNLIYCKCSVALRRWSQFYIWTNLANHSSIMFDFYKSLT